MALTIRALEGDALDDLLARHYGPPAASAALRVVLEANPGLAAIATEPLPAGTRIVLPDLPAGTPTATLWE